MIYLDKTGLEHYDDRIKQYVGSKIAEVVNTAPEALDTLQELAAALGNDENFSTTISNQIGQKVDKVEGKGLSEEDFTSEEKLKLDGIEYGAQVNTVTGVKGESENEYRVGQINITKADLGLDSVDNTADNMKAVKTAETLAEARQFKISDGISEGPATYFDGSDDVVLTLPTNINADLSGTAEKATADADGNNIIATYETKSNAITDLTANGTTITYTKGDGTGGSISTQDTHYTTKLIAGNSDSNNNTATTNGNVNLRLFDDSIARSNIKIVGGGATAVTSDNKGTVNITSQNTTYNDATQSIHGLMSVEDKKKLDGISDGANKYELPNATNQKTGGVKIGENITCSDGTISLTKSNVTSALGYTPQQYDTHYTTKLIAGTLNATSNAVADNGNVHLNLFDDNIKRSGINIKGAGATTVISDSIYFQLKKAE